MPISWHYVLNAWHYWPISWLTLKRIDNVADIPIMNCDGLLIDNQTAGRKRANVCTIGGPQLSGNDAMMLRDIADSLLELCGDNWEHNGKIHSLQLHTCNPNPDLWQLVVTWVRQTPMGTTLETLPYTWDASEKTWWLA